MGEPVTILQLDPEVPLDRLAPWLAGYGVTVRSVPVWERGVPSLESVRHGCVVLGGLMGCHETAEHPWLDHVMDLMVAAVESDVAVLAICLGHQLLAKAFGGTVVSAHPAGGEHGPFVIEFAEEASDDPVLVTLAQSGPAVMPESHDDAVTELPPEAVSLATTASYANQAFRIGSALGVQFHPEASPDLMARWQAHAGGDSALMWRTMRAVDAQVINNGRLIARGFAGEVRARHSDILATPPKTRSTR